MEPQKRGKYSKLLEPEEIEEVLMDEDSDEELEETDERTQSSSSSEDEDNTEETEVVFRTRRAKDSSNVFDFTGPPSGVNRSVAPDINAESSPLSIFMLFFRQIFQLILEETNRYFRQCTASKNTASTSAQSPDITIGEIYTFFAIIIQMGHDPQLIRLEVKHSQHWPSKGKQRRCRVCSLKKQTRSTLYFCSKCDVGLCIVNCFEKWHTHVNL